MSDKYAVLRAALNQAIAELNYPHNSSSEFETATRELLRETRGLTDLIEILAEREADKARIAELTGKPPEDYPDDSELCFVIDECDCLADYQTAQWLKELRRRRAAGITLETGE